MTKAFDELRAHQHEQVAIFQRPEVGLTAIIAIHDTTLGPALGGCRVHQYDSLDFAVYDALRLAQGMTYKNSLAGLWLGGGKSVIVADRSMTEGRDALFLSFGECVESLGGRYITAEDMGTSVSDISVINQRTTYVSGKDPKHGGGGDPSPHTAQGVFSAIRACIERLYGSPDLRGKRVAIQGMGAVGMYLAKLLAVEGVQLIVADTRAKQCTKAVSEFGAQVVGVEQIYSISCDIFSPCAIGATINKNTIPQLGCSLVAGAANNQLATAADEQRLQDRGILYAPDFAINAGGVILCADEREIGGFTPSRVAERVGRIGQTVARILSLSVERKKLAGQVAIEMAQERIDKEKASRRSSGAPES